MYPTLFKLPFLPAWLADIKSYGVMMMIAFLTGIWMACRRAERSRANPDIVLNLGFISLVCGVAGARAMFVLHYWDSRFANQASPLWAVLDIRAGGLEFWGGPLLVIPALIIYLRYIAKTSVRWYLDMCAPSLAWGLAITRIGCFLNGCCWGATCVDEHDPARQKAAVPWAVRFPYASPAMVQQFRFGQMTIPKELISTWPSGETVPFSREVLEAGVADNGKTHQRLQKAYEDAMQRIHDLDAAKAPEAQMKAAQEALAAAGRDAQAYANGNTEVGLAAMQSRTYGLTPQELMAMSENYKSKPAHPAQLYETISSLLICWVLAKMFYYRQRHGVVLPWFLMLYSIARVVHESIRQDNPLDVGGVTISQAISFGTFMAGVVGLVVVYKFLPMRSPRATEFVFEDDAPMAKPAHGH